MMDVVSAEIEQVHRKLQTIDGNLASLSFRSGNVLKRRFANEGDTPSFNQRRTDVQDGPGRFTRRRIEYDEVPVMKRQRNDDIDEEDRPKRTLPSMVTMPVIETKSREAAIAEMKEGEDKALKQRNRRLFSNLLVGTLQRFKKEETKVSTTEKAQVEKLAEVEKKLEEEKRGEREKAVHEKSVLLAERREQERELRALQRKKALMQYAEQKTQHYRRLQQFIQTKAQPTLFFLPAKHTLHSLELLKQSAEGIQTLIEMRQADLEKDLQGGDRDRNDDDGKSALRTHIAPPGVHEDEEEDEEDIELVVKSDQPEETKVCKVDVTLQGEESDSASSHAEEAQK